MKIYTPRITPTPIKALRLRHDLHIPKGDYLVLHKDGRVTHMTAELFDSHYKEENKRPRKRSGVTHKQIVLEKLAAAGTALTAKQVCALCPPETHSRMSATLAELVKEKQVAMDNRTRPAYYQVMA